MIEELKRIQKELKAPKNQYNAFGKYKYRSCEDILEAVKPLLGNTVLTLTDEIVNIGNRYYVKATAELWDTQGSYRITAYAREAELKKGMDEAQITGSASSYARKYALNGLFLIDDTKDSDTMDNGSTNKGKDTREMEGEAAIIADIFKHAPNLKELEEAAKIHKPTIQRFSQELKDWMKNEYTEAKERLQEE